MNKSLAIQMIYPHADSLLDFKVEADGQGFSKIVEWNLSEPQPTDEELQTAWLGYLKKAKLVELSEDCQSAILGGFTATNGHSYQFDFKDQDNIGQQLTLLLLDVTISSVQWKTKDSGIVAHTREEFIALAKDADTHKRGNMAKYWQKEAQLNSATTEEEVNLINF